MKKQEMLRNKSEELYHHYSNILRNKIAQEIQNV